MNNYELVFIAQPELDAEALNTLVQSYTSSVQNLGGQVTQVETWGKRRLAFPIAKVREGYYYLTQIQLDPSAMPELERTVKLTEPIIRYLVIRK
jgi:small subunit ribosomal protein S6